MDQTRICQIDKYRSNLLQMPQDDIWLFWLSYPDADDDGGDSLGFDKERGRPDAIAARRPKSPWTSRRILRAFRARILDISSGRDVSAVSIWWDVGLSSQGYWVREKSERRSKKMTYQGHLQVATPQVKDTIRDRVEDHYIYRKDTHSALQSFVRCMP